MLAKVIEEKEDTFTLNFYIETQSSGGLFGKSISKKEPWEIWNVQFKFKDEPDNLINIDEWTDKFNKMMIDLSEKVNDNIDCMPNISENFKCYPY